MASVTDRQRREDHGRRDRETKRDARRAGMTTNSREALAAPRKAPCRQGGGFFTIYKRARATGPAWAPPSARRCSIVMLIGRSVLRQSSVRLRGSTTAPPRIAGVRRHRRGRVRRRLSLLVWRLMNKPSNVDFLIATDSEMKKVNWTSRKELIGSTKVVIFFMFVIAVLSVRRSTSFSATCSIMIGVLKIGPLAIAAVCGPRLVPTSPTGHCSITMQFFVLRVASNKEDQVREALVRKVKIEGLEEHVGRILVPTERVRIA